jgi:MOSC domain-containing protein YiiM
VIAPSTQDPPVAIARITSIHVGQVRPLGPEGVPSAFVKHRVSIPVEVTALGLVGDAQADLRVHGGPEKAVYGYSTANYAAWRADYPRHEALLEPGGFGENLAVDGLAEADLWQPCFKFALRFGDTSLPKAMVRNGRSGWYYRVLQTGSLAAGDAVTLHERPNPDFPFTRLVAIVGARPALARRIDPDGDDAGSRKSLAGSRAEHARPRLSYSAARSFATCEAVRSDAVVPKRAVT